MSLALVFTGDGRNGGAEAKYTQRMIVSELAGTLPLLFGRTLNSTPNRKFEKIPSVCAAIRPELAASFALAHIPDDRRDDCHTQSAAAFKVAELRRMLSWLSPSITTVSPAGATWGDVEASVTYCNALPYVHPISPEHRSSSRPFRTFSPDLLGL
jgi:hypothetical protein